MDHKIEILIVEPGKTPRIVSMENTMEAAEELLGGTAQVGCFLRQRVLLISRQCQDGMRPNRLMPDGKGCVRGAFLLCGGIYGDWRQHLCRPGRCGGGFL